MSGILLAYYGDDFSGSSDVLEVLAGAGVRTVLFLQPPSLEQLARFPGVQAVGVAGLARSLPVEQMAILEPALAETLAATCLSVIREGLEEAVKRGVPPEAARDFLMGHLSIELAILFNETSWKFSQGCQRAIDEAKPQLFRPDWKKIFEPDHLKASVARITGDA